MAPLHPTPQREVKTGGLVEVSLDVQYSSGLVKALPERGRANEAVVALLAERLRINALSIAVVSGHGSPSAWPADSSGAC